MDTNSAKVLEALPNFNDSLQLIEDIKKLSVRKMSLESQIKALECENFKVVMTSDRYFVGGKPVAVSYYENAFKFSGLDNNLMPLRNELLEVSSELESLRSRYEVYKQMQDLYKTMVFAERSV